jgi:hypothetical protein
VEEIKASGGRGFIERPEDVRLAGLHLARAVREA